MKRKLVLNQVIYVQDFGPLYLCFMVPKNESSPGFMPLRNRRVSWPLFESGTEC